MCKYLYTNTRLMRLKNQYQLSKSTFQKKHYKWKSRYTHTFSFLALFFVLREIFNSIGISIVLHTTRLGDISEIMAPF